jgi:hypothetical protein
MHRRERYRTEAVRAIRHAFPELLKRPAARIARNDAVNALDKLVRAGKPTMAGRTLAYARAAFHWAEKRGKVPGNPFQGLPISAGATARERVLSDKEIAEVWAAAETLRYPSKPERQCALGWARSRKGSILRQIGRAGGPKPSASAPRRHSPLMRQSRRWAGG